MISRFCRFIFALYWQIRRRQFGLYCSMWYKIKWYIPDSCIGRI